MRAEDDQRQRALGDGQDAVARAVEQAEHDGRWRPDDEQQRRAHWMERRRDTGGQQRVDAAQEPELEDTCADLRRPDQ